MQTTDSPADKILPSHGRQPTVINNLDSLRLRDVKTAECWSSYLFTAVSILKHANSQVCSPEASLKKFCSGWLVRWSLTSLFSTNMAISEMKGQGWTVILLPSEGRLAIH